MDDQCIRMNKISSMSLCQYEIHIGNPRLQEGNKIKIAMSFRYIQRELFLCSWRLQDDARSQYARWFIYIPISCLRLIGNSGRERI